jgi:hypothetical protein
MEELAVVERFETLDHLVAKEKHGLEAKHIFAEMKKLHQVRPECCHSQAMVVSFFTMPD